MPLTTTGEIVAAARAEGRGVAALNVVLLESAEAIVTGAEAAGLPVVLQISENCVRYHGALEPILLASLAIARRSSVPVAVHLDHAESEDLVREAVALGVSSVMYDASRLAYGENVERTAQMASECHRAGVWLEAELGEVGGKDGVHAPGVRTDPQEAAAFVGATGVDALAVAVGSSHAMTSREAQLDEDLIRRLHDAVGVPLVLHGSSGVDDAGIARAVAAGITKVNLSTHLNQVFTHAVRASLEEGPTAVDPRRYLREGRTAMAAAVADLLRVIAG